MRHRSAFTLMELLVVISLIVLLISLLTPYLRNAKEHARSVECRTKLRSIMQGFQMFADDHIGTLPASYYEGPDLWQKSWAGIEVGTGGTTGSHPGTLVPYIGGLVALPDAYRCPSLVKGVWSMGAGSNGRFDYSSFASMSGAKQSLVNPNATWTDPGTGKKTDFVTAVVVEEDPLRHINGCCIEAGHGSADEQSTTHMSGSNIAAIDGSGHYLRFTTRGPNCYEWSTTAPSGTIVTFTEAGGWGSWNSR